MIHEATHAIQDLFNAGAKVKHIEADAYIAQALVWANRDQDRYLDYLLGKKETKSLWSKAVFAADDLWRDGKVKARHYDELVAAVAEHRIYRHKADEMRYLA